MNMAIQYRLMRPNDVPECVELVASDPDAGPRYSRTIGELRSVWLHLLGREALCAVVFEDRQGSHSAIIGLGVSAFVAEGFLHDLKVRPCWVGPELTKRIARGDSPLLSDKQVREANSSGGINVAVWEGSVRVEHRNRPEVHHTVVGSFIELHRGFLLKEIVSNAPSKQALQASLESGVWFVSGVDGQYVDHPDKSIDRFFAEPHLIGITRELALGRPGNWMTSIFMRETPQIGLCPSEQRLLLAALRGGTDPELSETLGISISAVKKAWRSVYMRVTERLPRVLADHDSDAEPLITGERGREKKQRLLNYLRDHPEELRPYLPRLVQQGRTQITRDGRKPRI